jgi:hypothetical protein
VADDTFRTVLEVVRSAERCSWWAPRHWPDLAVELLVGEIDDPEIAELAGLPANVTGCDTEPLVSCLYDKYEVRMPEVEDGVAVIARLMASDLRARPAAVTAPMIRLLARLAPPAYESDLATQCHGSEEYLDCDCVAVDPRFETELENLPPLQLPDGLIRVLARPLRSTLPVVQPPRAH